MKPFLLLGFAGMLPFAARANDSSFEGVGGTMRSTKGENLAIRMRSEVVVLTAGKEDFSTRADFVFQNETGQSQTTAMGFPEGNYGHRTDAQLAKTSGFKRFATFVDGRRVAAKRTVSTEMDDDGFNTHWIKTVKFAPHQTRRVRVEFSSPYGLSYNWGATRTMSYAFTGKNWRGNVEQSKLEVRVVRPGWWRAVVTGNGEKFLPMSLRSNGQSAVFSHIWSNWNAQQNVTVGLERTVPLWRQDASGSDNSPETLAAVAASQTVRVGAKPKDAEPAGGIPADGFMRGGVLYVGVSHLYDRLGSWGYDQKPRFEANLYASAPYFDLRAGKLRLQGREGATTMQVNGKTIEIGAPVIAVAHGSMRLLYVPAAPVARALGWQIALRGERLFTLTRGSWRG